MVIFLAWPEKGNWLGEMQGRRRNQRSALGKTFLVFTVAFGFLLAFSLRENPYLPTPHLPTLFGKKPEPLPADLFQLPLSQRRSKTCHAILEIKDEYQAKNGKVLSVILDPKGDRLSGGIHIAHRLMPADLQKGQWYRCELAVNEDGFLIVKKIEKY